jgi:hypothetical protein
MTNYLRLTSSLGLAFGFALLTTIPQPVAAAAKNPPAKGTSTFQVIPEVPIPNSVFTIPSQPSEGRNPFFPQSAPHVPPPSFPKNPSVEASWFVLNGITSPPKRTAMINGRTFEAGEEGEVRVASGAKVLIKCEEIRAESAIIITGGARRELRLRSGL